MNSHLPTKDDLATLLKVAFPYWNTLADGEASVDRAANAMNGLLQGFLQAHLRGAYSAGFWRKREVAAAKLAEIRKIESDGWADYIKHI